MTDLRYDQSYPPELWEPPPPNPPTGVTAGSPGSFTPAGSDVPSDITALRSLGALGQTTAWTIGQYVDLGDNSDAYWTGTIWGVGQAP